MSGKADLLVNALGRRVPKVVNGREQVPFQGVAAHAPRGSRHAPPIRSSRDYPADGDKRVPDLDTALRNCGLRDGMVISTHHHLRNGDRVAVMALDAAKDVGVKDLMWLPSASFPCHEPVIDLMDQGVVHHIEGSMNGPLGRYCSAGKMRGLGVLRSHGMRSRSTLQSLRHPRPMPSATLTGPTDLPPVVHSALRWPIPCMPTT
jgi:citrate lyase subunit alpha/citrate CoA-transferase